MKLETSVYNALQVLGISLTDTTPLEDLFNKSNLNIDKELDGFYEPTLFDYLLLNPSTTFSGQQ